jgi:hypothetical protein
MGFKMSKERKRCNFQMNRITKDKTQKIIVYKSEILDIPLKN